MNDWQHNHRGEFCRFHGKRDFLFSRYWRRDQDGSYCEHLLNLKFGALNESLHLSYLVYSISLLDDIDHRVFFVRFT